MREKKKIEWWPIGIIAAMLTFMGSVLFAVSIMVGNEVSLTSEDYYAKEIAYQEEIDKSSRALSDDRKPILRRVAELDAVELSFPGRRRASTFTGKATFFRPSDPKQDFKVALDPDAAGLQAISLSGRSTGLWLVQLEWSEDSLSYYHEQQIIH